MDLTYKQEIGVGAMVLAGLALFVVGYFWLTGKTLSAREASLDVVFTNVSGLKQGDPVFVSGVKKGRVVVFGVESDQTGSEELIVVAEKDQAAPIADDALRGGINRLVTDNFMVRPRDIRIVNERWLVKSTSGKISRQQNRDRYLEMFRK